MNRPGSYVRTVEPPLGTAFLETARLGATGSQKLRFVARQPVFDRNLTVFGYELLFRTGWKNAAEIDDSDQAARITVDTAIVLGFHDLHQNRSLFVNCTRDLLVHEFAGMLPAKGTVLEILEDVIPDKELLEACRKLRIRDYLLALDDVVSLDQVVPFEGVVDIVKVDFRATTVARQREIVAWLQRRQIRSLAEKVETAAEHRRALDMGFDYFQGFFLQRPEVLGVRDIPTLFSSHYQLLGALQRSELDFDMVEGVIRSDPSLCYRMLRYLNSPIFGLRGVVGSVHQALRLLGEREVRRWLLVALAAEAAKDRPAELLVWALVRARFSELLSQASSSPVPGAFLAGLLSALPALLHVELEDILEKLPVATAIKGMLADRQRSRGNILGMVTAYEEGNWTQCEIGAHDCGLEEDVVARCYLDAVDWVNSLQLGGGLKFETH